MQTPPRVLIKLGGAALKAPDTMALAATTLASYRDMGYQVIVVHGGGPAINQELSRLGITWEFVGGQRVTSTRMMEVIEATLCGHVNKHLVRYFGAQGLPVIGLSGADQRTLLCTQASPELGQVGSIQEVNAGWIEEILASPSAPIPLVAPVGVGYKGEAFNINADWSAAYLAAALKVEQLLFITDQTGIMDEEGQIIRHVDSDGLENMIECKTVGGGMLAKVRAVLFSLKNGISSVSIMNATDAVAAFPSGNRGTVCTLTPPMMSFVTSEAEHVAI
jgi:acetylglutamate kinase